MHDLLCQPQGDCTSWVLTANATVSCKLADRITLPLDALLTEMMANDDVKMSLVRCATQELG